MASTEIEFRLSWMSPETRGRRKVNVGTGDDQQHGHSADQYKIEGRGIQSDKSKNKSKLCGCWVRECSRCYHLLLVRKESSATAQQGALGCVFRECWWPIDGMLAGCQWVGECAQERVYAPKGSFAVRGSQVLGLLAMKRCPTWRDGVRRRLSSALMIVRWNGTGVGPKNIGAAHCIGCSHNASILRY